MINIESFLDNKFNIIIFRVYSLDFLIHISNLYNKTVLCSVGLIFIMTLLF